MNNLKRKLLAVAMVAVVSAGGAFAQRDRDKRPPKDKDTKVVVAPKGEKPPPKNNNNQDKPKKDGRKGRP